MQQETLAGSLVVALRANALRTDRAVVTVPHGETIRELVERLLPERLRQHAVVTLDGAPVPRMAWHVQPRPGAHLTIVVYPAGAEVLRPILALAVVVAAAVAAPYIVGAAGITVAAGYSTATVAAITAGVGAGLTAAGMLALNALIPPAAPLGAGGRKSQVWSLERAGNTARLYSAMPRILGVHRYVPPLAADVLPEAEGESTAVRLAVTWGYGPIELTDERFGELPIDQVPGVERQFCPGTPGVLPELSLYAQDYAVERVDAVLTAEGGPVTRRTAPGANEALLHLVFPRGLVSMERGDKDKLAVVFRVETAPVGGSWTVVLEEEIERATTTPIRLVRRFPLTQQVDVRVTRITKDRQDVAKVDELVWSVLVSITHQNPFRAPGIAVTALRVPAGEQANGSLQAYNALAKALLPDWDGSSWVVRSTVNPASLALAVLRSAGNGRPVPDERIALDAFAEWHGYCSARGLTCSLVVDWDGGTVWDVLRTVAATGDAIVIPVDGRWTPIIDREQLVPVQVITPRNSTGFQATRILTETVHALRVRFLDAEADYRPEERVVYADGYDQATATRIDEIEFPGVTSAALAHRHGRRRLAELTFRRERYQVSLDWEHLACRVGDRIEIAHDVLKVAVGWGRVAAVELDGAGDVVAVQLDEEIELTAGVAYRLLVRRAAGVQGWDLVTPAATGSSRWFALSTPIPAASAPTNGDLAVVGESEIETMPALVVRVRPGPNLTATIEAVPYHPGVYVADTEPIPAWQPRLNTSALGAPPVIRSVRRDIGTGELLVEVAPLQISAGWLELGWTDDPDGDDLFLSSWPPDVRLARLTGVPIDAPAHVRARWRLLDGRASSWSASVPVAAAVGTPPPNVRAAWVDGDELVWAAPSSTNVAGYRIRWTTSGAEWARATPAHDGLVTGTRWSARQLPVQAGELLIVAVSPAGIESAAALRVPWSRRDEFLNFWPVREQEEAELGWPGVLTAGLRTEFGVRGAEMAALWADPQAVAWPDPAEPAFPSYAQAQWSYRTAWTIPETVDIDEMVVPITPADAVLVAAQVVDGAIERMEYALQPGDAEDEPYSDGRLFNDGRGWTRIDRLPWLPWPRTIRAAPGRLLRVRIAGNGTLERLSFAVGRQRKSRLLSDIEIPPAGVTVLPDRDSVKVINVQVTARTPGAIVVANTSGAGVTLHATNAAGEPVSTHADVRLEAI